MPTITFLHPDGTEQTIDAEPGESVMQAAIDADVNGIVAECGGNAMCATCHVYVTVPASSTLPDVGESEDAMLDNTASPRKGDSRLSCQLPIDDEVATCTFSIPESQV